MYEVAEGMTVVPPNEVNDITTFGDCKDYVVVGGGKTSMDCVTHLLK
jgi:NADPH-dependent glutamate synthase beta subunit-like oxidoreductase